MIIRLGAAFQTIFYAPLSQLQVKSTKWQNKVKLSRRFKFKIHQRILFNVVVVVVVVTVVLVVVIIIMMPIQC